MKEDIKKEYKELFEASTKAVEIVAVPEFNFSMIDGVGNPRILEFKEKSEALHLFSKAVKKYYKSHGFTDYMSSPLEGVWDTYNNGQFDVTRKDLIRYTLMVVQPTAMTQEIFEEIKAELMSKSKNPYISDIYFKAVEEGEAVQILHIGAYDTEIDSTTQLMEYVTIQGYKLNGMHHEIYLNDPQKVAKEKLKTIIRYPITKL